MTRITKLESEMHPSRVAIRVIALREALGLSKSEFADSVGIDRSSYSKIEKGEKPLKVDMGYSICERYGVSLDYLYRGKIHQLPASLADLVRLRLNTENR